MKNLYANKLRELPVEVIAPRLGSVWSAAIAGTDRERAFRALEVATPFSLRRAVRNGSVWIEYASETYRRALQEAGLRGLMSAPGNPYHNAQAESFKKTQKVEVVYIAGHCCPVKC